MVAYYGQQCTLYGCLPLVFKLSVTFKLHYLNSVVSIQYNHYRRNKHIKSYFVCGGSFAVFLLVI